MSFLGETFSVDTLPQSDNNFDPLPAGWYSATISTAELRTTKAGTGQYIAVMYTVTGPTHEGRAVWGNLNIRNPNPQAESIGRQQLGELMRAIGLASVQNTDQLIGNPVQIKLSVRKDEQYGDSNDVKGYRAIAGSKPPMPAASAPAPAPAAAPAASTPPWANQ